MSRNGGFSGEHLHATMESAASRWAKLYRSLCSIEREHPDKTEMIDAWFERFDEMMSGSIAGTVEVLADLREREVPIYARSNFQQPQALTLMCPALRR